MTGGTLCPAKSSRSFACTQPANHLGPHVATNPLEQVCDRWPAEPPTILSADDLLHRTLEVEELDRAAFQIHHSSGLGSAYLIGSLSALVPDDVWGAAVASARIALAADRERQARAEADR